MILFSEFKKLINDKRKAGDWYEKLEIGTTTQGQWRTSP